MDNLINRNLEKTYCNPLSLPDIPSGKDDWYRFETAMFSHETPPDGMGGPYYRSISDPTVYYYGGKWYLYPSYGMAWVSEDFYNWKHVRTEPYCGKYSPCITKWGDKFLLTSWNCPLYVGDNPLGPFTLQASNPFSSKPGGFMTGAGHGSTIADKYGNYWHASTMRISVNYDFERRVGLFPAGFDADGVLYCNQNFADYPHEIPAGKFDAAAQAPEWMLLSYRKAVTASSTAEGSAPANAVDEDCRRWWSAGSSAPGEWLCVDLGKDCDVRAVQVNLADEALVVDFPADTYGDDRKTRHIETRPQISHYTVETSLDGKSWTMREDVARECSNGYYEYADGIRARYIRVTGGELPYGQTLRISGLRVFGNGEGDRPAQADAKAVRVDALDGKISWQHIENAQGCNVRYGIAPDKLYQSWLVYDADEVTLSTLMAGQEYYVCVDSFNENGITTGKIIKMEG